MSRRIPDFFIVGAPKCGTTSLAVWLAEHPRIYMARPKEPSHFDTDSPRVGVSRLTHYLRCFKGVGAHHLAVGEASPNYLFSNVAIPAIQEFNPSSRFIVTLRDPVRMAPSLHAQLYYNHHEDIADFATAWRAQQRRREGMDLPQHSRLPQFLQYQSACSLGTQLARLFEQVGRERVCVLLLEDIEREARSEYQRVLEFLGVPDDGRTSFGVFNASKARVQQRAWLPARNFGYLKQRLGLAHLSMRDTQAAAAATGVASTMRVGLAPELQRELEKAFAGEVRLLESLLGRNLHEIWGHNATPQRNQ